MKAKTLSLALILVVVTVSAHSQNNTGFDEIVRLEMLGQSGNDVLKALNLRNVPPAKMTGSLARQLTVSGIEYDVAYNINDQSICEAVSIFPRPKVSQRTDCLEVTEWIEKKKLSDRKDIVISNGVEIAEGCSDYENNKCPGYTFQLKEAVN